MDLSDIFFHDWTGIIRTILVGIMAYVSLVLFLRISGKRTLAQLNAFDFIVTVALGSSLSAIMLQATIPLAQGVTAIAVLILVQFAVTYASVRSAWFADLARSEPALLVRGGKYCTNTMRRERITEGEVMSAIRNHGGDDVSKVDYLFLESEGTLSVVFMQTKNC